MARKGKAKAGSSRTGRLALNPSQRNGDGEAARTPEAKSTAAGNVTVPQVKILGESQTPAEAEKRLYAYRDQMMSPQPAVFPPLGELHARLTELGRPSKGVVPADEMRGAPGLRTPAAGDTSRGSPDWLDQKLNELVQLLSARQGDKSGIADIHAKLADIGARIDALSAQLPGVRTIEAVETKLDGLSRSLDESRDQNSAHADRIAAAAREILAATARVQEAREGFEAAVHHTASALGQTVVATASRAAVLAAGQVATALQPAPELSGDSRIEAELRALNRQSQEIGERTEAALERLHATLREFLDYSASNRGPASIPVAQKQPWLHRPISSPNSAAYTRGYTGFGAAPADKPRLDVFDVRGRRGSDLTSIMEFEEAGGRAAADTRNPPPETKAGPDSPLPGPLEMGPGRDGDNGLPLLGISIVAFILLMAAAALYYLQAARNIQPSSSVEQEARAAGLSPAERGASGYAASTLRAAQAALLPGGAASAPALLSSASEDRAGAAAVPERAADDLKDLEAAAGHGDSEAQFRIGTRFLSDGAFSNGGAARAARWLEKAAGQGHLEAQFMLASLYERGAGVAKDETKAMSLYRNAANAGHIRAMHNLGVLLSARESLQDYSEAAVWFARAAQAGLTDSQYNLALLYERGLGVEQDLSRAYLWYRAAGRGGDKEAARQAERLKRALPAGADGTQASSWRPTLEDRSKAPDWSSSRG
jgi:localization factor PodJL